MQSTTDENTVNFHARKNKDFLEAKEKIEARISQSSGSQQSRSGADELEKLAALKEKGILSQAEFDSEKAKILGSSS